ncbi:MAG: DUF1684 domain-containing protein [Pseudomonadota bacterium]
MISLRFKGCATAPRHATGGLLSGLLALASLALAVPIPAAADDGAYTAEIEAFRAERLARLRAPLGWLSLRGLYWVEPGRRYTLGSAGGADIQLDGLPHSAGELRVGRDVARFHQVRGAGFVMQPDTAEEPTTLTLGRYALRLIDRDGDLALRVWDTEHPALTHFPGIPQYPIDPALNLAAEFQPYAEPRQLRVDTVIPGLDYRPVAPGVVAFEIDGRRFELEAYDADEQLFIIFADATSRDETYPAGRYLYIDKPAAGDAWRIDFNRAYNPPCVFNDFATCPLAAPRNRLPVAIRAGERYTPALHVSKIAAPE